jgi:hypothetical protein
MVWVRFGDGGDCEKFDSLDDAVEHLIGIGADPVTGWEPGGFETNEHWGRDYVSLYHGDDVGNFVAELDQDERSYVEGRLNANPA